jgi:hypothetical protein
MSKARNQKLRELLWIAARESAFDLAVQTPERYEVAELRKRKLGKTWEYYIPAHDKLTGTEQNVVVPQPILANRKYLHIALTAEQDRGLLGRLMHSISLAIKGSDVPAQVEQEQREAPQPVQHAIPMARPLILPVGELPGFRDYDIWYDRMRALESIARGMPPKCITFEVLGGLQHAALRDDHWINRELAQSMINSYNKRGDFQETQPFKEKLAAQRRLTIATEIPFGYRADAIWYDRQDALKAAVHWKGAVPSEMIGDLRVIAEKEDDWRIVKLAKAMLESHKHHGTFREAGSYENAIAYANVRVA